LVGAIVDRFELSADWSGALIGGHRQRDIEDRQPRQQQQKRVKEYRTAYRRRVGQG
jgi:hypothetical protein